MKLKSEPTTAELLKSMGVEPPAAASSSPADLLAAFAGALSQLPASREELDRILADARDLLAEMGSLLTRSEAELSGLVNRQMERAHADLAATADQAVRRVSGVEQAQADLEATTERTLSRVSGDAAAALSEVRAQEDAIRARLAELDILLESNVTDGRTDTAELDALRGLVQAKVEEITAGFARLEEKLAVDLAEQKKLIDHRLQGVGRGGGGGSSAIKILNNGVHAGDRRALNLIGGTGVDITTQDRPDRIDVTLTADLGDLSATYVAVPTGAGNSSVEAAVARALGYRVVTDAQWAGGADPTGVAGSEAAFQAALDDCKAAGGGIVWVPDGLYLIDSPVTVWARCRVLGVAAGASLNAAVVKAGNGLNNAIFKLGATDGTDPYWHWGEVANLYVDGNKANQVTPSSLTITAASITSGNYVATITTSTAHGYSVGDVVRISGVTPDAYNGDYRVDSVPTATTFTITQYASSPAAGTVFGTVRRLVVGIANSQPGETSAIRNVYVDSCLDDGIWQGNVGTPAHYEGCSSFNNGGYGFDIWSARAVTMLTPSGDSNGLGLIRIAGKAGAGGTGANGAVAIIGIKAEKHVVPVLKLDDYDGAVTLIGGSIEMDAANTGAAIQRTAASSVSTLDVIGTRIAPKVTGNVIFNDLSTSGLNYAAIAVSANSYTFHVGPTALGTTRIGTRRVTLTDAATVAVNASLGSYFKLSAGASRTIGAPTNPLTAQPQSQEIVFDILNNTAGAITTTWNAAYVLAKAWVDPGAGERRLIRFIYDGTSWVEASRTSAALTSADLTDFQEAVEDRIGALLAGTADIDVTYNDGGGIESFAIKTDRAADTAVTQVASGLTGATAASRYVGATTGGAPASGTFSVGDWVADQKGGTWTCITAGTPGVWRWSGARILDEAHADAGSASSAAEQTLASLVLPGGIIGVGDLVRFVAFGDFINTSGSAVTYTWKFKIGATTVLTSPAVSNANNANRQRWRAEIDTIFPTTTSERVNGQLIASVQSSAATTWSALSSAGGSLIGYGTAAEDTAAALNMILTCQLGTSVSTADIFLHGAALELIRKA